MPKLTTSMARHEGLVAALLRQAGNLKAGDNMTIIAILANLTRHSANIIPLAGNGSFVTIVINELDNSGNNDDRRKCALYALRNLTSEPKAQERMIANKRLLRALSSQHSKSTSAEVRIEILRVVQNLSNDPSFLLRLPNMLIMEALKSTCTANESSDTQDEEKHLARDIMAGISKWAWSSAHTAAQAKAIYLGEDLNKSFGHKNPAAPFIDVRRADQWE